MRLTAPTLAHLRHIATTPTDVTDAHEHPEFHTLQLNGLADHATTVLSNGRTIPTVRGLAHLAAYHPTRAHHFSPENRLPDAETLTVHAADGTTLGTATHLLRPDRGEAPASRAIAYLLASLGPWALCPRCAGTALIARTTEEFYSGDAGAHATAYNPTHGHNPCHWHTMPCFDCVRGYRILPLRSFMQSPLMNAARTTAAPVLRSDVLEWLADEPVCRELLTADPQVDVAALAYQEMASALYDARSAIDDDNPVALTMVTSPEEGMELVSVNKTGYRIGGILPRSSTIPGENTDRVLARTILAAALGEFATRCRRCLDGAPARCECGTGYRDLPLDEFVAALSSFCPSESSKRLMVHAVWKVDYRAVRVWAAVQAGKSTVMLDRWRIPLKRANDVITVSRFAPVGDLTKVTTKVTTHGAVLCASEPSMVYGHVTVPPGGVGDREVQGVLWRVDGAAVTERARHAVEKFAVAVAAAGVNGSRVEAWSVARREVTKERMCPELLAEVTARQPQRRAAAVRRCAWPDTERLNHPLE